jgi:hypothetical protein
MRPHVVSAAKDSLRKVEDRQSCLSGQAGLPVLHLTHLRTCAAIAIALVANSAFACPVCFGGASGGGQGMNAAIIFLLIVVGVVQAGFVALFWSFWRRAKELRRRRESFHLISGGAR